MERMCFHCAHYLSPAHKLPCSTCVEDKDKPEWVDSGMGQEPKKEEADMQTHRYEIVAPAVLDKDGNVVEGKEAIRIAHGDGLLEEPSKLDLLQKHHEAIVKAGRDYKEVQVNIRPFCG